MINVALVGFGYSAQTFHLPFLVALPDFRLFAVMSSQREKVLGFDPTVLCYDSIDTLLHNDDIDLVIITAPNDVHFSLAKACLTAGKHVLVEKPFVTNIADGETLIALAKQHQCILSVFHNRRWDGDFLTLQSLLSKKRLGKIKFFESRIDRFRPRVRDRWREHAVDGGGIWFDLGPHLVDQVLMLFGWPSAVSGRVSALRDASPAADFFHVMLHYDTHEVVLQSSPFCASETLRFHIQGELGSFTKFGLDPQEQALKNALQADQKNSQVTLSDHAGTLSFEDSEETVAMQAGDYAEFFKGLAQAIMHAEAPPVDAADALKGIELIKLIEQASQEGKRLSTHQR